MGVKREMMGRRTGGGEEGKKSADATQSELSFVNEPRCLRDKEDKSACVRSYPFTLPQGLTHKSGPYF